MPTIKYLFLPFLWSLLPGISPYLSTELSSSSSISATKKQYFSEIVMQRNGKKSFLRAPQIGPFSWNNPYKISFIEMQAAAAKNQPEEVTGPLKSIIQYQGQDSITFDIEKKNFNIYGAGMIAYEDAQLTAENISLNWTKHTIIATGKKDELGKIDPKPVFQQGNTKYIAEEIRYNFESKRGTARRLFTKLDDALIRCHKAKMDIQDTYYADRVKFTSCNLTNPHYFIKARDVKFVKDKKVASGPFQFYFDGVPTILGFIYGIFYMPIPKVSGIIRPQIGEDGEKGFFLKEGGYYFYFNDYIDLALRASLYSKGDFLFATISNYKKRYAYKGHLSYEREIVSQTGEIALQETSAKEWRLQWQHNTINNRVSSLTAEVDIHSRSPRNSLQTRDKPDQLNAKTQSKVRYTYKFLGTPYTLNTSLGHSKDFQKNFTHITFPQIVLGTAPIYPFRWKSGASKHWYEDIYFKHTSEFQSDLTNVVGRDTLDFTRENWPKFLRESKYGAKHTFPVETNLKLFTYFNFKPSFNYTERWYFKKLDYKYDATKTEDSIWADTLNSFNRVWDYNLGGELQTTIYGTHIFSDEMVVQGVRHRIEPSVGITYTPDFSKDKFGYWQKIQTKHGEKKLDRFAMGIYGTPKDKASALLTVKVDNTLELKVKNTKDVSAKSKKVPVFESLSVSTTYDFLEDHFPLGDINLGARTRLLDSLISLEYSSTFDPYVHGRGRTEELAWQHGRGLGILKKYSFKIGTTLKSKKGNKGEGDKVSKSAKKDLLGDSNDEETTPVVLLDSTQYVNFNMPWELTLSYHQDYNYEIEKNTKKTLRQLNFNGKLNITNNWKIGFNSTYDLDKKELVGSATRLSIHRDLHCWQMSFDWSPLANRQSYEFSIGIKAPMFQDLKYPHSRAYDKL